jgi:hypothetical protein
MDTQRITSQLRLSNWGDIVKERIASGQSVNEFCDPECVLLLAEKSPRIRIS